jgi:hypothetical protein
LISLDVSPYSNILLLLRSLYILSVFAYYYYCGFYFAPFRPSNSDFGYIEEGESAAGYTFTPCVGSFACPGIAGMRLTND